VGALTTTVAACLMVMTKVSIDVNNVNETCYKDLTDETGGHFFVKKYLFYVLLFTAHFCSVTAEPEQEHAMDRQ
jgi:hypothetical protein